MLALAPPAAAAPQPEVVLFAQALAAELTAIDARRPDARRAVAAWKQRIARCGTPRLRTREARAQFASVRSAAAHRVALRALAPDLERLATRLRALSVTDREVRGGIREVLLDYENVRDMVAQGPPDVCAFVRASKGRGRQPEFVWLSEDVRGSSRALDRRDSGLVAAQRALLRIEADPQLARALDTVFEHITAGLDGARVRERLVPPFTVIVDPAEIERLRAEAAGLTRATEPLFAAQERVGRELTRVLRRGPVCGQLVREGLSRRPSSVAILYTLWSITRIHTAVAEPIRRFEEALGATAVTDRVLTRLLGRQTDELALIRDTPTVRICRVLRAWKRRGWTRRHAPAFARENIRSSGEVLSGIRLEDETIHRAVLARRGVPSQSIDALLDPVAFLLATLERD
jgi:hypothetical protein